MRELLFEPNKWLTPDGTTYHYGGESPDEVDHDADDNEGRSWGRRQAHNRNRYEPQQKGFRAD